ncbi:MAG: hypothetical protein C5B43_03275 [Verrucomicrobia bacterium]|nr:MAG: hypothetical protein C5B43_03275 [Verrucomicrobiota bacterium]
MNDDLTQEIQQIQEERTVLLANRFSRTVAFFLDLLLIGTFSLMLLTLFIIPKKYPGTMEELWLLSSQQEGSKNQQVEKMSPQLKEMIQASQTIIIFLFWAYFSLSEILLKGSSLGKLVFKIRVVNANTLRTPSFFESILRSGLKTFSLLAWFPVFTLNFFIMFFTKHAQAGHDLLTRTIVIQNDSAQEESTEEEENLDDEEF